MNCEVLSTLYLKANGEIPCHDDHGERITLGRLRMDEARTVGRLLENDLYRKIRESFREGMIPWEGVCRECAFFRPEAPFQDLLKQKHIANFQVETSLACTLACPGCSRLQQVRTRVRPHLLDISLFEKVLKELAQGGYRVDFLEYCGQGEPLSRPHFWKFVETGRRVLPDTQQRLITNGNYDFHDVLKGQSLDEIYVSCDGLFQENYEKYRIGGSVAKTLRFMRDARHAEGGRPARIIWKYILFEFNDTDEELIAAQETALELGIDVILFVLTHSDHHSMRFTPTLLEHFPLVSANARIETTPIQHQHLRWGRLKRGRPNRLRGLLSRACLTVDEFRYVPGRYVSMNGWVLDGRRRQVGHLRVNWMGGVLGIAKLGYPRPDVQAALGVPADVRSGFLLINTSPPELPEEVTLDFTLTRCDGHREKISLSFQLEPDG